LATSGATAANLRPLLTLKPTQFGQLDPRVSLWTASYV